MIVESYAMGRKQGKTTKSLEQVVENLLRGNKVLYFTDELSAEEVWLKIRELCEDVVMSYLLVYTGKLEMLELSKYPDDLVVVVDTNSQDIKGWETVNNDVYAYYRA